MQKIGFGQLFCNYLSLDDHKFFYFRDIYLHYNVSFGMRKLTETLWM